MTVRWSHAVEAVDWAEMAAVFEAAPLGRKAPEALRTAFSNSLYRCFLHDGDQLIGAGRVLADGVDCAYLCDIVLLPQYQGRGLGGEIVEWLVEKSRAHKKIILYAVPGKEDFYGRFGFRPMSTAMAIFENPAQAQERGYLMEPAQSPPPGEHREAKMPDRATPNLPSRDFEATFQFFRQFGFEQRYRDEGWMILALGQITLEFFPHPALDPATSWFSCCLRLADVDAFFTLVGQTGVPEAATGWPRLHRPRREAWGGLVGALIDIDGTLLRLVQE